MGAGRGNFICAGEDEAERHPLGTGPWKFVEHVRGDRIVYEAVENHWRAVPHFKRLVFLKIPEPATRMAMLWAGSVDVIEIGGEYVEELKAVGIRTLTMPNVAWVWGILAGNGPPNRAMTPQCPGRNQMPNVPRCAWPSTWQWISRPSYSKYWEGSARRQGL
jgi:ABC-type transport system substrate-binding protein